MSALRPLNEPLTLENCDREPIHVPGSIQPHGALLAFDRLGRLTHASANVAELLGIEPRFGRTLRPDEVGGAEIQALIREVVTDAAGEDVPPVSQETRIGGRIFDCVVHAVGGTTICEFERREHSADEIASFAQKAYRLMDRLKRQRTVDRLLDCAVEEIRALTGFDRVMAYRFRHDDSGDVVAEAKRDDLDAYVGRRYPASDIPAQARRLYTINTLRLIADVGYAPVPVLADAAQSEPLDMSLGVLRSVSPIHVEYLRNMGVSASMSVSIVVSGRLWGLIACHHMAPLQVHYSVRMAADVMAQLIASSVQSMAARAREAAIARAAWLRTEISTRISQGEDVLHVLAGEAPALRENLGCHALVVLLDGRHVGDGELDDGWIEALLGWLGTQPTALVHVHRGDALPPPPANAAARYCGVLAMRFDATNRGWLVGLRREQVETIRWGGRPEKEYTHGPLGPRLTPRGSFDEWRETVRGLAVPWNGTELEIASQLLDTISRMHADRVLELDRMRSQLWAVLGHDLRNPLQSLTMAATAMRRSGASDRMSNIIKNSADRMRQLMHDVLDVSRVQNGLGLGMNLKDADLVPLARLLIDETEVAHPDVDIVQRLPAELHAAVDAGRFAQVIANLLSNARHHGERKRIEIEARTEGDEAVIEVANASPPIPAEVVETLFDPFKRRSLGNERNRTGMGLGLYIAHQIVRGHGGTIRYRAEDGRVIFEVRIPREAPADADA